MIITARGRIDAIAIAIEFRFRVIRVDSLHAGIIDISIIGTCSSSNSSRSSSSGIVGISLARMDREAEAHDDRVGMAVVSRQHSLQACATRRVPCSNPNVATSPAHQSCVPCGLIGSCPSLQSLESLFAATRRIARGRGRVGLLRHMQDRRLTRRCSPDDSDRDGPHIKYRFAQHHRHHQDARGCR